MSLISDSKKLNSATNKAQWYWIPKVIVFFLSVVFGWAIFWKKG